MLSTFSEVVSKKFPSKSEVVPTRVPLKTMFTNGSGSLVSLSNTLPVTRVVCAFTEIKKRKKRKNESAPFVVHCILLVFTMSITILFCSNLINLKSNECTTHAMLPKTLTLYACAVLQCCHLPYCQLQIPQKFLW